MFKEDIYNMFIENKHIMSNTSEPMWPERCFRHFLAQLIPLLKVTVNMYTCTHVNVTTVK